MAGGARRFFAFYIDVFIATLIASPFIIFIIQGLSENPNDISVFYRWFTPMLIWACVFAVFKDAFGRSPGKMILRLNIISANASEPVPRLKLILRNLTTPIWPIEALVVALSKDKRRITDRLLHLHVEQELSVRNQRGRLG